MYFGFYQEALELIAEHHRIALIADTDLSGKKIPDRRLVWLVSLAMEQGLVPLVASYNAITKHFVVVGSQATTNVYIDKQDAIERDILFFNL